MWNNRFWGKKIDAIVFLVYFYNFYLLICESWIEDFLFQIIVLREVLCYDMFKKYFFFKSSYILLLNFSKMIFI